MNIKYILGLVPFAKSKAPYYWHFVLFNKWYNTGFKNCMLPPWLYFAFNYDLDKKILQFVCPALMNLFKRSPHHTGYLDKKGEWVPDSLRNDKAVITDTITISENKSVDVSVLGWYEDTCFDILPEKLKWIGKTRRYGIVACFSEPIDDKDLRVIEGEYYNCVDKDPLVSLDISWYAFLCNELGKYIKGDKEE